MPQVPPPVIRDARRPTRLHARSRRAALLMAGPVCAAVLLPLAALVVLASGSAGDMWRHLAATVLPHATLTTLLLMTGVGVGTAVTGLVTAWLVTMCRFPGRRVFEAALVLPLAVPTYIVAFAYIEVLGVAGPVQMGLRDLFGFSSPRDYWFPEIRSLPGAVFVMSAVLYPYVYLTTRVLFLTQSAAILDVSRTLGAGPRRLFTRIALPLARPATIVGVSLALMECLNDIGAVEFFGVRTLTFAVYETWLNRGSLTGAAQLSLVLLLVVLLVILAERAGRGRARYHAQARGGPLTPFRLRGWRAALAVLACLLPVLCGFLLPAGLLASYASRRLDRLADSALAAAAVNSLAVATLTALAAVLAGLLVAYAARLSRSRLVTLLARLSAIGYAVPGTVLAVGILYPLAALDNAVDGAMRALFGLSTGLLLTGSGAGIVYACTVRFLAVSHGTLEAGLTRITEHLDQAARTLGHGLAGTFLKVHAPLLRRAIAAAFLLVFVDTMKELSATVLLRPFDFETLATYVYSQASRGAYEDASVAALGIVALGVAPLVLLLHAGEARRSSRAQVESSGMSR